MTLSVETDQQLDQKPDSPDQVLGQYIPLLYHYNMLVDEDRVGAFREAIELIVRRGMHVVELGGGTGILSSLAARRGAHVTCVERNPDLVRCARRFVGLNGLQQSIKVVQADAATFVPESPVDVVICEMLHVGLLREKQVQVISAFKQNYVRHHGPRLPVFLPEASILMTQIVAQSFDFAGYHAPVPLFQAPLLTQPRTTELSTLSPYASISYESKIPTNFNVSESVTANCTGEANAIRFVTQNVIAIDMKRQHAITWPNQCLVLPLANTLRVDTGQTLNVSFRYQAGDEVERLASSVRMSREHLTHTNNDR